MTALLPPNSSVCAISARRFGDAIINAALLKKIAENRPDIRWIIWTKPEFVGIFKLMGFTEVVTSEFPIAGGFPKLLRSAGYTLIRAILRLRNMNLDASLDFVGDAREALIGRIIAGHNHHSPRWNPSHWMRKLIFNAKISHVKYINIPTQQTNIYECISYFLSVLSGFETLPNNICSSKCTQKPVIAFHLHSSQEFKSWPNLYWQQLSKLLHQINITPVILCSHSDAPKLNNLFSKKEFFAKIVITSSIEELINQMKSVDLLVGVDSFLVHLASALGKKAIVINAGNLPQWWQPPNSHPIGTSGGCTMYPCSNRPACLGTPGESKCIKSIMPSQVFQEISQNFAHEYSQSSTITR